MQSIWKTKPPFGTQINLAHSLAQGLVAAVPLNEGGGRFFTDAFTGGIATTRDKNTGLVTTSIDPTWLVTKYGYGVQFNGSWQIGNFLATNAMPLTSMFSMAALLMVPAPASGNNGFFGTGASGIEVRIAASKVNLLKTTVADMGSSSTSLVGSTYYSVGVSYDGATSRFYLNGAADGSSSHSQTFVAQSMDIGGPGSSEVLQNGSVLVYVYVWRRVLNGQEFLEVANNPWAFYAAPRRFRAAAFAGGVLTTSQPMTFFVT